MKPIDNETLNALREKVPFIGHEKEEEVRVDTNSGTVLHPYTLSSETSAHAGDMMVVYHTRHAVADQYRQAIRALDLGETEAERFSDFDRLESFRSALEHRLDKTKLWHYAPDQRDEVKAARSFLRTLLTAEIPYGETLFVPEDETETFLADEANRLGVKEYYYCVEEGGSHLDHARETVSGIGHRIEERVERLVTGPIHRVQHLAESVIDAIPDPIDGRIRLMSA